MVKSRRNASSSGVPNVLSCTPPSRDGRPHPAVLYAARVSGAGRIFALGGVLAGCDGPTIVCAQAGNVNTGAFDPLAEIIPAAHDHGAWVHVDGAFGLWAAASPALRHLVAGVEQADSVATDAHKWLNVPYESGFVLVRDPSRLGPAFGMPGAAYLPGPDAPRGGYGLLGPESSRRARALPIWATLAAYGRAGYQALVERHCDLAAHLAAAVDAAPDLERLAEVPLNVVCFRYRPDGLSEPELHEVNRRLGEALLDDGRVFAGGTVYGGRAALRPAISNWRTTAADLDLFVEVVRELGAKAAGHAHPG